MRVAVLDEGGSVVYRRAVPTPAGRPTALLELLREAREASPLALTGAVVGVAGPVSYAEGRPLRLPNVEGWEAALDALAPRGSLPAAPGPAVQQGLADALRLPLLLANDADLGALGEHRFGAGRGVEDMLYVTCSTGVGAGVILGGRLLHGRRSLAEVGWATIDRAADATVEDLGSGTALGRIAGADGPLVTARAEAGDPAALKAFAEVAQAFAVGVLNAVFAFMPERVVIGGGVSQAGDLLLGPVRRRIASHGPGLAITPEVVRANGGDDVGLFGAHALWHDVASGETGARFALRPSFPQASG